MVTLRSAKPTCAGSIPARTSMSNSNLVVKRSQKYNGLGVFSNKDFQNTEIIYEYTLTEISKNTYDKLSAEEKSKIYKKDKYYDLGEIIKYLNHSCSANTHTHFIWNKNIGIVYASKNIGKGEEITANYMMYNKNGFNCLCGYENCVKKVSLI